VTYIHPSDIASVAAAFPGLKLAVLQILNDDAYDEEELRFAAVPPAPWRNLRILRVYDLDLHERHIAAGAFSTLLSLLRGAGELTDLSLEPDPRVDVDAGYVESPWTDADVAALLAHAPAALESLTVSPIAALTDATVAGCPHRPALKTLKLGWLPAVYGSIWLYQLLYRPELTPAGLLALGRALPGLQSLKVYCCCEHSDEVESAWCQLKRAWVEQLNALGCEQPALGARADGSDGGGSGGGGSDGGLRWTVADDAALLLAIRRALAREAAAGVRLA
jgi:hypothetical protein